MNNIDDIWGLLYAIMKSLNINKLVINKKYLEITNKENFEMTFQYSTNGLITIKLKEKE